MEYLRDITYCDNSLCSLRKTCVRYIECQKMKKDKNAGFVSMYTGKEKNCSMYWKEK